MNQGKGQTTYIGTCPDTGKEVEIVGKQGLKDAGYDPTCVIRVCNGDRKKHKGLVWNKIKSSEKSRS